MKAQATAAPSHRRTGIAMNNNVIKFERPKKPKEKRPMSPRMQKMLIIAGIILGIAAVYTYYALTLPGSAGG
jgi:hypothetical protein